MLSMTSLSLEAGGSISAEFTDPRGQPVSAIFTVAVTDGIATAAPTPNIFFGPGWSAEDTRRIVATVVAFHRAAQAQSESEADKC